MSAAEILATLEREASPRNVAGMARFGIVGAKAHGVPVTRLRQIAKPYGRDRKLARDVWKEGSIEAKLLASLLDEPATLTLAQAERYLDGCENWAVTDGFCLNLFREAPWAYDAPARWAKRDDEFGKRAAFALIAGLAVRDKTAGDDAFRPFVALGEDGALDGRNFVKKAVGWALRTMGHRSPGLRRDALAAARRLAKRPEPGARWVASDVRRALEAKPPARRA